MAKTKIMKNNSSYLDNEELNSLQEYVKILKNKAELLVSEGLDEQAFCCIEIANCAEEIKSLVIRMSHLLSNAHAVMNK